jgi:hypothetical protein
MTVEFVNEPVGCRTALEDGLKALAVGPSPAASTHLAVAGNAQAPPPLPVYILPLDELAAGNVPQTDHPVAWEYLLVTGGQAVRTAEVHPHPQTTFTLAAISTYLAAGLAQAIDVAENDPGIAAGRYEMRLVRVPALYVTALWLKDLDGAADYYVPVPPTPDGFVPHTAVPASDFFQLLQTQAAGKVRATPQTPGSPSN